MSKQWKIADYSLLLKQSLPQIGSVVLTASIARIDWILLGIFAPAARVAEYSFAYKVYELSPLPMLIFAPILLSRFSKYFTLHSEESLIGRRQELSLLIRVQMTFATLIPLGLNLVWSPLIDALTQNKYGASNAFTFFMLSICIPLQYLINFFWSIHFAQNKLALIFKVTFVTCMLILLGDVILIPLFSAQGAAVAYFIAITVEYILYLRSSALVKLKEMWQFLVLFVAIALVSGATACYISENLILRPLIGVVLYAVLVWGARLLRKDDWQTIVRLIKSK